MPDWLLHRLFALGDQPTPRFAAQSTLNWMRALAILVADRDFSPIDIESFYNGVQRRPANPAADTAVFERLLMAQHHTATLVALATGSKNPYNVVRAAIVAWYYVVYEAASAMTLACSGKTSETHAKTARIWHADIVNRGLAIGPFGFHVNSLVQSDIKSQVLALRNGCNFNLVDVPHDYSEAWGAACGYLRWTANYTKDRIEDELRRSPEFKKLGVANFRTKPARELRDGRLASKNINFLSQAFRYRGKANYRDSIYLSYRPRRQDVCRQFLRDLATAGAAFLRMANGYCSRRVEELVGASMSRTSKQMLCLTYRPNGSSRWPPNTRLQQTPLRGAAEPLSR